MSEPNYHEIEATVSDLDEQIEVLQAAKRDFWKGIRDEHGKKLTDQIKIAVKLNRMDGEKRLERDEIEEGAFRILSILQKPRAPRATHAHTREANEIHERPSLNAEASPEAGPQAEASPVGTDAGTLAGHEGRSEGEAASADLPTHSNPQEPTSSPVKADSPASTSSPEPGTNSDDFHPEDLAFLRKPKSPLRPHCLTPDCCAGYGSKHCHACLKARDDATVAA